MLPAPFTVVLDANVLFPFTLRDTLLRAAAADFYQLRWTDKILDEMEQNLVSDLKMDPIKAKRLREVMERAFPEAHVNGYEPLIASMQNDPKDRHVAAAAIKAGAQVITTANIKDFLNLPEGIEAQTPDDFLCSLLDLAPKRMVELLHEQAEALINPPLAFVDILDRLARDAPVFVEEVRGFVRASL